jgi:hypothetical protein
MIVESTPLALLPIIAGILVLTARFYAREGAISIFNLSFIFAAIGVLALIAYMTLAVLSLLPLYAWVGFGGFGAAMTLIGLWTFTR